MDNLGSYLSILEATQTYILQAHTNKATHPMALNAAMTGAAAPANNPKISNCIGLYEGAQGER